MTKADWTTKYQLNGNNYDLIALWFSLHNNHDLFMGQN